MQEPIAPDPAYRPNSLCCWPRCWNGTSRRYKVPLCDYHAQITGQRVEERDRKWIENKIRITNQLTNRHRVTAKTDTKPKQSASGTIYYVQVGSHIKIGWTSNLNNRMLDYPPNCQLLATHLGTREEEQALHKKFAHWLSHGREWYPLAPVLLDHIKRVIRDHGEPAETTFGARPVEVPQPRPKQYVGGKRIIGKRW